MPKLNIALLIIVFATLHSAVFLFAQDESSVMPLQKFSFSLEGGANLAFTDFKKEDYGPSIRGGLQYFFYPHNQHRVGVGVNYAYQQIKGKDYRSNIVTDDGLRELPPSFSTDIHSPGLFTEYSYLFTERFSANVKIGLTYNIFRPKDNTGEDAFGYKVRLYSKYFTTLLPEAGLKYRVTDNIDISLAMNYSMPVTDYLDDVAAPNYKDSYMNIFFGVSYSISQTPTRYAFTTIAGISEEQSELTYDSRREKLITDIDTRLSKSIRERYIGGDDAFISGSARFKSDIYPELDKIIEIINVDPASLWRIEAHVDNQLDQNQAKLLTLERAKAVYDYFIIRGVQQNRLRYYGLGGNLPLTGNNTEEGRRINRRVMIIKESTTLPAVVINDETESSEKPSEETDTGKESFNQFILRGDDTFEGKTNRLNTIAIFLLDEIVSYIQEQPESRWKIEGYTDNDGSEAFLKQLSLDRAKAVYDYLVNQGINPGQLTYEGFGSSSPIANNDSIEGRRTNRRVIIIRTN